MRPEGNSCYELPICLAYNGQRDCKSCLDLNLGDEGCLHISNCESSDDFLDDRC